MMGWLSGWTYRKSHVINSASGAGTNYQIRIKAHYGSGTDSGEDVYLNGHCRTDFGDIRFTDDDGTTLLDYWMEEKSDSDYAVFWVEVKDDLSSSSATIYIYYGKSDATYTDAQTHGENTFLFFDDFPGTSLDTDKWTDISGDVSVSDSWVTYQDLDTGTVAKFRTSTTWQYNVAFRAKAQFLYTAGTTNFGFRTPSSPIDGMLFLLHNDNILKCS